MATPSSFVELFLPLQGDLLAYILSQGVWPEDAEDVLQDCAAIMFRKIEVFEMGTNFRAWAFSITKKEVLRSLKKQSRRPLSLTEETYEDFESLFASEEDVPSIRLKALLVCLQKISEPARKMVEMRYAQGLDADAIAQTLRRPIDSIYTTLSRIRKSLLECVWTTQPQLERSVDFE